MRFNFETNFIFCNLFQSKNTSDRFVYSCFGDITGQDGCFNCVNGGAEIFNAEEDIGPCFNGKDAGLLRTELTGNGAHLQGIRDDDPVKAQLPAEFLLQNHR